MDTAKISAPAIQANRLSLATKVATPDVAAIIVENMTRRTNSIVSVYAFSGSANA
jgi:hypothetical protein